MNGIYSFQASTRIYMGEYVSIDGLSIDGLGKVAPASPGTNIQIVGYAMNTVEEGEVCQVLMRGLDFISERGPIFFYAPKNPIPYENLEFEFDLKSGKPKTPVFELIFEGTVRTFREVPMESRKYQYCHEDPFLSFNFDIPLLNPSRTGLYATANYQYNCTIIYNERYSILQGICKHYELLLCIIGKNTYVFQEAHIQGERHFGYSYTGNGSNERYVDVSASQAYTFTIYVDTRKLILHEEVLQEKTDPRFNIELGECDRSLPSGKYDIEI